MLVLRTVDETCVKELKRLKLYNTLISQHKPGEKHKVYALGNFPKDAYNGDVFIWHVGFEQKRDNGFEWIHIEDGVPAEREALENMVRRIVGDNPNLLHQLSFD